MCSSLFGDFVDARGLLDELAAAGVFGVGQVQGDGPVAFAPQGQAERCPWQVDAGGDRVLSGVGDDQGTLAPVERDRLLAWLVRAQRAIAVKTLAGVFAVDVRPKAACVLDDLGAAVAAAHYPVLAVEIDPELS